MQQNAVNELGQYIPLHYHYQMLSDKDRMNAFQRAIEGVVKPWHTVVELGSGTGVLSFFAARLGASVWSVEYNPALMEASSRFIRNNGFADKVRLVLADAATWLPPEPVDVVVCEMLHSGLLREKQVQVITSFRNAHKKRFGTVPIMIPTATLLGVQPVMQTYDFNGFHAPVSLFQSPYAEDRNCVPCLEPAVYEMVDYDRCTQDAYHADLTFRFPHPASVNALRFITKNLLSIDYTKGITVDWHNQHLIMPLPQTMRMKPGQTLQVRFSYRPGASLESLEQSLQAFLTADDSNAPETALPVHARAFALV